MTVYQKLLIPTLFIFLYSCEKVDDPANNKPDVPPVDIIVPTGNEKYLNEDSDYIYDQTQLHTFELTLSDAALATIDANPAAEQYVEGSLTFEGETISPVGIRYKGSIGAYVGCVSGSDWSNPSGRKTCTKLSMKVKFNWQDTDDKFYGIKKLQFHSQNLDASQMRDRLGYWLFRQMGVPAPRSVHARLIINGAYTGLYALVEQVDGRFTRENFDDGKGNVYKEIWPINADGRAHSEATYLNKLETNEDENPSAAMIKTFGEEISTSNDATIKSVITKWMDIDEIMAYAVVDRVIKVDDGPFHWYCGGGCTNHNYYWYEEPTQQTLHLIPWDLDNAFENIVIPRNPVTPIADDWGEITNNCLPFQFGSFKLSQRSAACDKLTAGWVQFDEEYNQMMTKFMEGPFSEAIVDAQLDAWSAQIRAATTEANQTISDAITVIGWESAMRELRSSLQFARSK